MSARRLGSALLCAGLACAIAVLGAPAAASADAIRDAQWYLSSLGVEKAWTVTKGAGVKVAVIDGGVDGSIPDLRGAVVDGKDFSGVGSANGQKPVFGTAGSSHGTNVAALLAGRGHGNGAGVIGTAPAAQLLSASVAIKGQESDFAQVAAAIRWAADAGAKVINMSFTDIGGDVREAVEYAEAKDVVLVAGTGDAFIGFREGLAAPANLPGVLSVTGVDKDLKTDIGATIGTGTAISGPFSTNPTDGTAGWRGTGLEVANPRGDTDGAYGTSIGTSFSTPIVAGIVALVRARFPTDNAANVINRVIKSATPAGGPVPNNTYGYGIVNAYAALTKNVPMVSANPLGTLVPGGSSGSPSSDPSSSSPAGSSSPAQPASTPAGLADSSSGLGAGAWIAIVVVVLVAALLVGWLISRNRRAPAGPGGPPPPGYRPPR